MKNMNLKIITPGYLSGLLITSLAILLQLGTNSNLFAQKVNFSEHVAPIIYQKCSKCHRAGEIAPMPLTNYAEVSASAEMVKYVTGNRYMPPWQPDPAYRHYKDQNVLSDTEIQTIKDWVEGGSVQGDPELEPQFPEFPTGSQLGKPDLVLSMKQANRHTGNNRDQYQIFVIPTGLTENREIAAIEFRPGNKRIVHHAIIEQDTTGIGREFDAQSPDVYGYEGFGGFGTSTSDLLGNMLGGWTPGSNPHFFPEKTGKILYAGADLLVQMHYAPSVVDELDSSYINIFFAKTKIEREVLTAPVISPAVIVRNERFIIPPNVVKTFHASFRVPLDISLISVYPHMHLLGKSWLIYATSPTGSDTIPIIKIDDWDFNWQSPYLFPRLLKVPTGYTLHAFATYDNTANNPNNPHSPPIEVRWGENTSDEMILTYFELLTYQAGDDQPTALSAHEIFNLPKPELLPIQPNPVASNQLTATYDLPNAQWVDMQVVDVSGKVVVEVCKRKAVRAGKQVAHIDISQLSPGVYNLVLTTPSHTATQRWIRQ
jgi:hypothetical protein